MTDRRWGANSRLILTDDHGHIQLDRHRLIQTPWFGVYVHRLPRADDERDLHDHPWWFATLILRGGYTELYAAGTARTKRRTWRAGSIHRFPVDAAHRITAVHPGTTTLVFTGRPHGRGWGFRTPDGWVDHSAYDRWRVAYDSRDEAA